MWLLWCVGLIVHSLALVAVRDLYVAPTLAEVSDEPTSGWSEPPAKRLVLLLADGVGSDVLYSTVARLGDKSFLRGVMEEKGAWGVATGTEPSEGRSPYLALTAGITDSPPLFAIHPPFQQEFDHIFNRSAHTFYFGDPRVPDYYSRSASTAGWSKFTYPEEWMKRHWETDVARLDGWVFDTVEALLANATKNYMLNRDVRTEGVVFFVHLRGPDLAAHIESAKSDRAISAVKYIDQRLERLTQNFEDLFGDEKTAFVLVSDHGFVDRWYEGRHGGGTPDEVSTPILAWGSGVSSSRPSDPSDTPSPEDWKATEIKRRDIAQVDVAPLLSSLLGLPVPVHSMGVIPEDFLNVSNVQLSTLVASNAFQLADLSRFTSLGVGSGPAFYPKDFSSPLNDKEAENKKTAILVLIGERELDEAYAMSHQLMRKSLEAICFYRNYNRRIASSLVILALFGWALTLLYTLVPLSEKSENAAQDAIPEVPEVGSESKWSFVSMTRIKESVKKTSIFVILIDILFCAAMGWCVQGVYQGGLPVSFYAYFTVPVLIWWYLVRNWTNAVKIIRRCDCGLKCLMVVLQICFGEMFILTMFHRLGVTFGFVLYLSYTVVTDLRGAPLCVTSRWLLSSLPLTLLPFYTTLGYPFNYCLFFVGGFAWTAFGIYFLFKAKVRGWDLAAVTILYLLLGACLANGFVVQSGVEDVYRVCFIISWDALITVYFVPLLIGSSRLLMRLFQLSLCACISFILLTVRHETLSLLVIAVHLGCWLMAEMHYKYDLTEGLKVEATVLPKDQKRVCLADIRRSLLYFIYLVISYFAVGLTNSTYLLDTRWSLAFTKLPLGSVYLLFFVLLKASLTFLLVTFFFVCYLRLSKSSVSGFLVLSLCFANLSGLQGLAAFLLTPPVSLYRLKISLYRYFVSQLIPLLILLLFPICIVLTGLSFVQLFQRRRNSRQERPVGLPE